MPDGTSRRQRCHGVGSGRSDWRWAGHRHRKPVHGYKAPVTTDQEAGLIRGLEVTTAPIPDAAELGRILPEAPGAPEGDSAFAGSGSEASIRACGGTPCIVHTGTWGGPEALARLAGAQGRRASGAGPD